MDEGLLSSVVEAYVRIGKPELLSARVEMLKDSSGTVSGAHTFGSLIKAYGHAGYRRRVALQERDEKPTRQAEHHHGLYGRGRREQR